MEGKIKDAFYKLGIYWDAQKYNFYFGMVLCMLFILGFPFWTPGLMNAVLFPSSAIITYILCWLFNGKKKPEKHALLKNISSVFAGSLWVLLFTI